MTRPSALFDHLSFIFPPPLLRLKSSVPLSCNKLQGAMGEGATPRKSHLEAHSFLMRASFLGTNKAHAEVWGHAHHILTSYRRSRKALNALSNSPHSLRRHPRPSFLLSQAASAA